MSGTFAAVRACVIVLLTGAVLRDGGVTAGRGKIIDWRHIPGGDVVQDDADTFDTARLFVAFVGTDAALRAVSRAEVDVAPAPPPAPEPMRVHAFMADSAGRRVRHFDVGDLRVMVQAIDWLDATDADVEALAARLAVFVA